METITKESISQQARPTSQFKRSLLPIDQYTAQERVSRNLVEECGRIGILQIRKHKGKTYVVDVPIASYPYAFEATEEPTQLIEQTIPDSSKRTWQIATALSIAFIFAALFANFWFYMDRQSKLDRLNHAYASIKTMSGNFRRARQKAETIQNKLEKSTAELARLQNELGKARTELKTVRKELTQARQNLKNIQQRNAEAAFLLDGQIQN